uniref:EGF-like domain-containing protein n=1 Tax=Magallana gigas TaxID=29159 RepID=A0A8W8IMD6_MAGGI|nr:uncharacterized protein LOC117690564 [Crassostrea gigas]
MDIHCAILLLIAAVAGVSAASNLNEDKQLVDRSEIPSPGSCSPCSGNVCLYGGICHVDGDRPVCYCAHNYVGHVCGIKLDHSCKTHACVFLKSFERGRSLGQWILHETHYVASNQLIAKLPRGGKTVLTTGEIYWGYKKHNLFFRVMFYNALQYVPIQADKVIVILQRPYADPQVLRTLERPHFKNHVVSNQFCIELPKTGDPKFAISFKIICASTKCAKAVDYQDVTQISLMGVTIQETTSGCSH